MQTRGAFPELNSGYKKSQSRSGNSLRSIKQTATQSSVAGPKRRRQLTEERPRNSNPFSSLQGLAARALRGK